MSEVLAALTFGNLLLSVVAGLFAGLYLARFHPAATNRTAIFRAAELCALGTILYWGRIAFATAANQGDVARVIAGWLLWVLFSAFVALGAVAGAWIRARRVRDRATSAP